jgi:hypothetical protein
MESIYEKIQKLAKDLTTDEPLDGDQTEELAELFLLELNYQNGNITSKEYDEATSKFQFYWLG